VPARGPRPDAATLERLVPDALEAGDTTGADALRIHAERYEFAARHLGPGRLLDLACGTGYGTRILAERGQPELSLLGVDVSESAIAYAREHWQDERTRFEVSDALAFRPAERFDHIVSIETIEHLPDPEAFVAHLVGLLRPGGLLVASVPTTPSVDANPFHLHDFSEGSFRRLFRRHGLVEVDCLRQDQPYRLGAVLARSEVRMQQMRSNLLAWYLRHPASLFRRVWSTLRHGLKNKYLTVAWRSPKPS
jgi:2-polyprenyl-3-methyl-5-hydroxy-6-metoxy-1,4-benzoquinol methylase